MKHYNFDEIIDRQGTDCIKYDTLNVHFGRDGLLPLWVADMDFRTPDFITDAIRRRLDHPVFGYTCLTDDYYDGIIRWNKNLHNWDLQREWISFVPGIVKAIACAVEFFTQPGDKVIIQPPVYHPFRLVPLNLNREVACNPLILRDGTYEMDFDNLESIIDKRCKLLILSSPHNPAGIVWDKATLKQLAAICHKHNIIVISDEIHSEMVYPGYIHHPFPTVSQEASSCSVTFAAPSKTFNIAGIISSYAVIPDSSLRKRFYSFLKAGEFDQGSMFSYIAATAAYSPEGEEWRTQMIDYVINNAKYIKEYISNNIPEIKVFMPQASFLVWLDCRELGLSQKDLVGLFVDRAGLALNDGSIFGDGGAGFMRINIGCPQATLKTAMHKLKEACTNN